MDSAEKAMRDAENQALFVAKNRAKQCRRCKADPTDSVGTLDKRGYCQECERKRQESMPAETREEFAKPVPGESTEQCNARLASNKSILDAREKVVLPITCQALLRGEGGQVQVTGPLINHCSMAVSLRANIASATRDLLALDSFVQSGAGNIGAAWASYSSCHARILKMAADLKHHEAAVFEQIPELVREPIMVPKRLEQPTARDWVEL